MIPRFGFIKQKRGVWDVVKISTGPWIQYADHKQALAEKDREIQQIREHEFQRGYQEREAAYQQLMVQRDKLAEDLATTKAWKDDWKLEVMAHHKTQGEYNTLMAQTVRFARGYEECYCAENVASKDVCLFHEAQAFLKEREGT